MFASRLIATTLTVLAATFAAILLTAKVKADEQELEIQASIRKAAGRSEVHAVGLYQPVHYKFTKKDVTDWPKLIRALQERKTMPVKVVLDFFSENAEKLLARDNILEGLTTYRIGQPLPPVFDLQDEIVKGFNLILERNNFYQLEPFKNVSLGENTKSLIALSEKRTAWQTARMNWELLATIFPIAVLEFPTDYQTVRVQVRAEKDVVLVLSCHTVCRWDVDVKPGSKVTGLILCGHAAQKAEIHENPIEVPILYRATKGPDNIPRQFMKDGKLLAAKSFGAYGEKDKDWNNFVAGVKEATGKDFTSFQGGYQPKPKDEPYIIPPKK